MDNINLVVGQTLLVELDEFVEGELVYVGSSHSFIRLSNVRTVNTNSYRGVQDYYNSEIRSIEIIKEPKNETDANVADIETGTKAKLPNEQPLTYCFERILAKLHKYVFINQIDDKYHDAIKYIQIQQEFGISMESVESGRHSISPSLLSFVTLRWIFIFDIKWLRIPENVGDLLINNRYRRVLHNGRLIKDVLMYRYGITMGKCFDTMVAHIAVSKADAKTLDAAENVELSIPCCVEKYLQLPEKFFVEDVSFDERPMTTEIKLEAAKRVAFLLDLRDHFLHEIMLETFYNSCRAYADSVASNSDLIDSMVLLKHHGHDAIKTISPFALDINRTDIDN